MVLFLKMIPLGSDPFGTSLEDKLRLGIKNKLVYFVLLSACIIFEGIMKKRLLCYCHQMVLQ